MADDMAELAEKFPKAFGPKPVPLAISIREPLTEATGWPADRVVGVLEYRTRWLDYQRAVSAPGSMRHGLDGTPVSEVTEDHRASAAATVMICEKRVRLKKSRLGIMSVPDFRLVPDARSETYEQNQYLTSDLGP